MSKILVFKSLDFSRCKETHSIVYKRPLYRLSRCKVNASTEGFLREEGQEGFSRILPPPLNTALTL